MRILLDQTDRLLIAALARCSFLPASPDKRFAQDMTRIAARAGGALTERQRSRLNALVYRYRRQIDFKVVAKAALRLAEEQTAFRLQAQPSIDASPKPLRNPLDALFSKDNGEAA